MYSKKGKLSDDDWNNNKLSSLINDCINIENNIYPNNTSNILLNNSIYSLSAVNNRYKAENLNYLE